MVKILYIPPLPCMPLSSFPNSSNQTLPLRAACDLFTAFEPLQSRPSWVPRRLILLFRRLRLSHPQRYATSSTHQMPPARTSSNPSPPRYRSTKNQNHTAYRHKSSEVKSKKNAKRWQIRIRLSAETVIVAVTIATHVHIKLSFGRSSGTCYVSQQSEFTSKLC